MGIGSAHKIRRLVNREHGRSEAKTQLSIQSIATDLNRPPDDCVDLRTLRAFHLQAGAANAGLQMSRRLLMRAISVTDSHGSFDSIAVTTFSEKL
jgi:hypothetical protein